MSTNYREQFAEGEIEAGTLLDVIDQLQAALADAERKGAERMRESCEELVRPVQPRDWQDHRIAEDHELADLIRALSLPTEIQPAKTEVHLMRADGTPSGVVIVKQGALP